MLPRFRADLLTTTALEDDVLFVEVADPVSGTAFRFYDFEYALAQQLNGQTMDAVVTWAATTYGAEVTPEALQSFVDKLAGLGFLEPDDADPGTRVATDSENAPMSIAVAAAVAEEAATHAPPSDPATASREPDEDAVPVAPSVAGEALFEGPELVELNSSPWPTRLLPTSASSVDPGFAPQSGLDHPWVAPVTGNSPEPDPGAAIPRRRPAISLEETNIASIAHAIIASDFGAGAEPAPEVEPPRGVSEGLAPSRLTEIPHVLPLRPEMAATVSAAERAAAVLETSAAAAAAATATEPIAAAALAAVSGSTPPRESERNGEVATGEGLSPSTWVSHLQDAVSVAVAQPPVEPSAPPPSSAAPPAEPIARAPRAEGAPATTAVGAPSGALEPRTSRFPAVLAIVLIGLAVAGAARLMWPDAPTHRSSSPTSETPAAVHIVSPQPTVFHRWFPAAGVVVAGHDQTLGFPSAGHVQDALAPGTTFSTGETIARLKGTAERELAVNRLRARIAFLEQLRDSSVEGGNKAAVKDAEAKLGARRRELALALADLAKLEIRATQAGAVAQVLVSPGAVVAAQTPVVRLRSTGPRAVFALPQDHLVAARALTFCRVEAVPGDVGAGASAGDAGVTAAGAPRAIDCTLPAAPASAGAPGSSTATPAAAPAPAKPGEPSDDNSKLAVDLPANAGIASGTPVRLARARYENVFPVPQSAVFHHDGTAHVWVTASAGHHAEMRAVEIASTDDGLALVSRGIRAGDSVIVDPPAGLDERREIYVAP